MILPAAGNVLHLNAVIDDALLLLLLLPVVVVLLLDAIGSQLETSDRVDINNTTRVNMIQTLYLIKSVNK